MWCYVATSILLTIHRHFMIHAQHSIQTWCESQLARSVTLHAMRGDAGQRRYYRLRGALSPMLAVVAPPESEKNTQWKSVHTWLNEAGVRVPQIHAVDIQRGFWLVEDLGDTLLYNLLNDTDTNKAKMWYERCFDVLLRIQGAHNIAQTHDLPAHDASALIEEMSLFHDWFMSKLLGVSISKSHQRSWQALLDILAVEFSDMPLVPEHGDYQSRNILLTGDQQLAVIDFQDAARGSWAYDLVSLLKDCYLYWPPSEVEKWLQSYVEKARHAGVLGNAIDMRDCMRHFDWIGLQRHLRVLGTFARLHLRDGKSSYLQHVPCIMRYVDTCLNRYTELQVFLDDWQDARALATKHLT